MRVIRSLLQGVKESANCFWSEKISPYWRETRNITSAIARGWDSCRTPRKAPRYTGRQGEGRTRGGLQQGQQGPRHLQRQRALGGGEPQVDIG